MLCEVQTDMAVVAVVVDDDAILAKILVPEDESGFPVGEDWKDVQIPVQSGQAYYYDERIICNIAT